MTISVLVLELNNVHVHFAADNEFKANLKRTNTLLSLQLPLLAQTARLGVRRSFVESMHLLLARSC